MNIETSLYWVQEMLQAVVILTSPAMLAALVLGLMVAVFPAATSIQEMNLSYIPKMAAVVVVLFFSFSFMLQFMVDFMINIFNAIANL